MRMVPMFLAVVITSSAALAQQNVPPPPLPAADQPAAASPDALKGPSLEATMKYIQDKINQRGAIHHFYSDSKSPVPPTEFIDELKVVAIDPAGGLSLQESDGPDGAVTTDTWRFFFKDVEKLTVLNSQKFWESGGPSTVRDVPTYLILEVDLISGRAFQMHSKSVTPARYNKKGKVIRDEVIDEHDSSVGTFTLKFRDEDTAMRVTKAILHAVELCGGGKPDAGSKPELF